jgi:hypothetical protein
VLGVSLAVYLKPRCSTFIASCRATFQCFLFRGLVSAPLRDAHLSDLRLVAEFHIAGAVKAPIGRVPLRRMLEDLLMTLQRGLHLVGVNRVALQHAVVGDQALGALGQENLVTEFHRLQRLAPLD